MLGKNYNKFFRLPENIDTKIYNLKDNIKSNTKKKKSIKKVRFNKTIKHI